MHRFFFFAGFMLLVSIVPGQAEKFALPPNQPLSGPGGMDYPHASVSKSMYDKGSKQYWLFEPSCPSPSSAPLIVFNHGWSATKPQLYGFWIEHIVRRGNIVVFPRYQASLFTSPKKFTLNAIDAVKASIVELEREGHVKPDLERFAIVGHSMGGLITAGMAALAHSSGLPSPKAIMCVEPGKTWGLPKNALFQLPDLGQVPSSTLLLTVVGDRDDFVKDIDARKIFYQTSQIPLDRKNFVVILSDTYGKPSLIADHFLPTSFFEAYDLEGKENSLWLTAKRRIEQRLCKRTANALDYYGIWKLWDALCEAAFYGKNREYALGNTKKQRFMGRWSDGTPVKELLVKEKP